MDMGPAISNAMGVLFSAGLTTGITYNGSAIRAHIEYGGGSTGSVADTAVIEVQVADVETPQYRDPVIINGTTWRVYHDRNQEAVIKGDGHTWRIPIKKDEKPSFK